MGIYVVMTVIVLIVMFAAIAFAPKNKEPFVPISNNEPEAKSFLLTSPIAGINKNGCEMKHVGGFIGNLVPEPDNEFDPNAIKIMHEDGTHLGYIPAKETATVRSYLGDKFKKYPCVGAIKWVKDEDYDPEDNDDEPDEFFVGRVYIDSEEL